MIREMTMDEAFEVMGGDPADPFANSGSSLLNWDPLATRQPAFTAPSPLAPPPPDPFAGVGQAVSDGFGCAIGIGQAVLQIAGSRNDPSKLARAANAGFGIAEAFEACTP